MIATTPCTDWSRRIAVKVLCSVVLASLLPSEKILAAKRPDARSKRFYARGARVPATLANRVRERAVAAAAVNEELKLNVDVFSALSAVNANVFEANPSIPKQLDWNALKRVTPAKDQGQCGSCWAFAGMGAFESAYLISNNKDAISGGYPSVDVSEQEMLDCVFVENDCVNGGWHEVVFLYLLLEGATDGSTYRYHGAKGYCTSNVPRSYYAANWGYAVDSAQAPSLLPSDKALKEAVLRYGPIAASVCADGFDSYAKYDDNGNLNPRWGTDYPGGIFRGTDNARLSQHNVDHEVLIYGWDDSQGIWLVKNSWGPSWGDQGCMKLAYQTSYIGFGASWILVLKTPV